MAELVASMPSVAEKGRRYPWDQWFDGQAWKLTRGEDFLSTISGFRATARSAASVRGLMIRITTSGDAVWIQAIRDGAAR